MVVCLLIVILVIIIERYVNRSDTKAIDKGSLGDGAEKQGFFNQEEMFSKSQTGRSMTVKLKTQKTADLDMQGESAQDFLKTMYGEDGAGADMFDSSCSKITKQQKTKYVMHMIILVAVHLFVFWYVPITGNYQLYNTAKCDDVMGELYGCKNFHKNGYLRIFYVIMCTYLFLSSLQIRYGFPIYKKPSSVLQYNDSPGSLILANIFSGLPFMVELRALLDFTFSKTALDIFQFWQLW
jgi:hypothetical protein